MRLASKSRIRYGTCLLARSCEFESRSWWYVLDKTLSHQVCQ